MVATKHAAEKIAMSALYAIMVFLYAPFFVFTNGDARSSGFSTR